MPGGKRVQVGVWEGGVFVGAIIYGTGACPQIANPFGVGRQEAAELVRVAMRSHSYEVSKCIAISLRLLRKLCPKLRVIVSYADPEQDHHGGIYQAGNWLYVGETKPIEWFVDTTTGKRIHTKTLKTGRRGLATKLKAQGKIESIYLTKLKYVMPLDAKMTQRLVKLKQPYPKRVRGDTSDTPADQAGEGGAVPTRTLSDG